MADRVDGIAPRARAGHQLEQAHIARRVEEVRDQEVAPEALRHALGQGGEADRRGVGRNDRSLAPHALDFPVERLFDLKLLDHRLDDPVDVFQQIQMVVEVAGADALGEALVHEGRGVGLQHALDRAFRERAAVAHALWRDIEQHNVGTRISGVSGDRTAHHARADDRDLGDRHHAASSTVAMPWPPPMHCVASA